MRGVKAKKLRKLVYGKDYDPRFRVYYRKLPDSDQMVADDKKREYQRLKKETKGG